MKAGISDHELNFFQALAFFNHDIFLLVGSNIIGTRTNQSIVATLLKHMGA